MITDTIQEPSSEKYQYGINYLCYYNIFILYTNKLYIYNIDFNNINIHIYSSMVKFCRLKF